MKSKGENLEDIARGIRKSTVEMVYNARSAHIGSALSATDILTALYFHSMNIDEKNPQWEDRDRFILSKGHACSALYITLAERGFFSKQELMENYTKNGTSFTAHTNYYGIPGIEVATGSLGHGMPIGVGMAFNAKLENKKYRTFVLLSDGECDEGSTWEAFLSAQQLKLDNLTAIIDYNKIQSYGRVSEVLELEPFADKLRAFNWEVKEVNGHSVKDLTEALDAVPFKQDKPNCIIAHTVKGKGVSYMENTIECHYLTPSKEQYLKAMEELSK